MKVNLSTQIEVETRLLLESYCDKSEESIASVVDRSLIEWLKKTEGK